MRMIVVNRILCAMLVLLWAHSLNAVTIEQAMIYYNNSEFEKAYDSFFELADIGNTKAQFNIGVMYARGEFVEVDLVESYAWMTLVKKNESTEDTEKVLKILETKLTEERIAIANLRTEELLKQYSNYAVENRLLPDSNMNITEGFVSAKSTLKVRADYPTSMLRKGISGIVDIQYLIEKDGTVRYPTVLASTNKSFARATVEAIKKNKYKPASLNGKAVPEYGRQMRHIFHMEGAEIDHDKVKEIIEPLEENAKSGGGSAKYIYAYTITMMASQGKQMEGYELLDLGNANYWFSKAAQDGFSPAKYELGRRLAYGQYCNVDTKKALFWLEQAANQGLADAQLMLGLEYISGARTTKNEKKGLTLIKRAADTGYEHAMLRYTWIMASTQNTDNTDLDSATKYLSSIKVKDYDDTLSYYETAAALYSAKGQFKEAQKAYKLGMKVLDELNLESDRLANIKAAIDNSQQYVETL